MTDYAEAHFSTKQSSPGEDARVPGKDGHEGGPSGAEEAPREGAQAPDAVPLLRPSACLPKSARLLKPPEFRRVYDSGRRYDGRLMSVFVMPNGLDRHRLGITASRKLARRAVDRNRLKRLLREAFRLSGAALEGVEVKSDWVLNPKRSLLEASLAAPLKDFQDLLGRVRGDARGASAEAGRQKP